MKKQEIEKRLKEIDLELESLKALEEKENVYQMGIKILINSYYGSLSLKSSVSAGQQEYFSTAITSVSRIANIFVGQEQCKKISELTGIPLVEEQYGRKNYLDFIAQSDTDSNYISIEEVIKKKFGKDYEEQIEKGTLDDKRLVDFSLNYINKIAMPLVREKLDGVYAYAMNAHLPDKLQEDPEVICDNFISIAPKMYFARKFWDEGVTLAKPKLKVTGLSMVRSSTPKFYRQELEKAMEILITGNLPKVINFCKNVEEETKTKKPSEIAINQGVTSLNYDWDETIKKFRRWVPEKSKFLSAPINSRASLIHNKYIKDNEITTVQDIEPGDKISFIYMKEPNLAQSNAFAFKNEIVFNNGLDEYIDYNTMYDKGFMTPIKLITDPLKWDLTPQEDLIDDDEW